MPELPEVETTVRGLRQKIIGLTIKDVWTDLSTTDKRKSDTVANPRFFKIFRKQIRNAKVISAERRAKNILINLNNRKTILVHLKMTGHLLYGDYKKDPINRFIHFTATFNNGEKLYFSDMRKFGKITLLDTKVAHESLHLNNIGPEPLEKNFTLSKFKERLHKKARGKIKTVLMDQSVIAGIGNIYSDEILWRAGVHPERPAGKIKEKELKLMFRAMKETLKKGIDLGGDSMSDYRNIHGLPGKFQLHHEAYRRTGEKCRRSRVLSRGRKPGCKGTIKRKVINGRSAHFGPVHQK
ncbi:MAG: DNA-formamidopyrimidine glycosylase [Minisyncoccia bacterium]